VSDSVFVNGLVLHAYHGVMPHEGKVGQPFILDLVLDIDLAAAAKSDKLADTVSYDAVVNVVSRIFTGKRYRLVEAAAGAVADAVLQNFPPIQSLRITVRKPHAPVAAIFTDVGVTLVRARRG
jgi:7,8-dihydroneopterin aldolase/epimerase/oxygenase